jgi:hypothetical protein
LLLNNKIKIEKVNQKENLIIEKETENESYKNKNTFEIKQVKEIKKEIINEIKNEKPIKGNLTKNEITSNLLLFIIVHPIYNYYLLFYILFIIIIYFNPYIYLLYYFTFDL